MRGTGKTCYQGTKPEEFQVEILGVLHGVTPGTSVVLARFSGDLIDKVGIFEGMSGSPVYIDGKKTVTLKGDSIAKEFHKLIDEYVMTHYGADAGSAHTA